MANEDIKNQEEIMDQNAQANEEEILDSDAKQVDEKIQQLEKQVEDMKELAQRTQAEFMNYKKRVSKEKQDITIFANESIISEILSVLDNFQRALDSEMDKESSLFEGVNLIKMQLEDILKKHGLTEIKAEGEEFDPNFHHAVMQMEVEGVEENKVVEVLQTGYLLKDKVIRPAMVKVSK